MPEFISEADVALLASSRASKGGSHVAPGDQAEQIAASPGPILEEGSPGQGSPLPVLVGPTPPADGAIPVPMAVLTSPNNL